jgi:hypothetical protein
MQASIMASYQYRPLNADKNEIRVLHLHPGGRHDPIHLSIEHIPFNPSKDDEPLRISKKSMQEIQNGLPDSWTVFSTLEGKPIYLYHPDDESTYTTWQSPVSTLNEAQHKKVENNSVKSFMGTFEAVSYTWGSAQPLSEVTIVDTQSPSMCAGTCSVGPNLLDLLHHLRRPDTTRALWIDAICINQENSVEKSEQVKRMHDIFKFANRTVVWLGQAFDDSATALQALEHMGKQLEYTSDDYFVPAPDASEKSWWDPKQLISLDPATWEAIAELMQRPYFERLWVVQEIQMAGPHSIVQCGETEVSWYHVRRAFIRCRLEMAALPQLSSLPRKREQRFADYLSRSLETFDARFLFRLASERKCTDPRDKVFALFGLLPSKLTQHIQSSYALSVRDVYIQAFLATVHFTRRLGLLDITNQHGPSNDHPSWVPDFRQSNDERYKVREGSYASGSSAAHVSFQPPNKLHVRGIFQGKVKVVSPVITGHVRNSYHAISELVSMQLPHISKDEILDWYVWIITQGNLSIRWHGHRIIADLQEAKTILQQVWAGEEPVVASIYRDWYAANLTDQQSGRFFVTDGGLLGCGPPTVVPGDTVCVMSGYDYPTLLRPAHPADQSTCYHYLGPLYVHGLMEGQALLGPLPPAWELIINNDNFPHSFSFLNHGAEEITIDDPRLDALPQEWDEIEEDNEARLIPHVQHYRNKITGEIINSDPRLSPESLEARGVHLETFTLV